MSPPLQRYEVVDCACGRVGHELEFDPTGAYILAADVARVMDECRQVLVYLIERHEASKTRAVTVNWNKATRLLAQLDAMQTPMTKEVL